MTTRVDDIEVTLLTAAGEAPDFTALVPLLCARLESCGIAARPVPLADQGEAMIEGSGFQLFLGYEADPLGAEAFFGTIARDADTARRNALNGVILGHEAQVFVTLCPLGPDGAPAPQILPMHLRIAHLGAAELARALHPLGMLWGPTARLLTFEDYQPLLDRDAPLELFLRFHPARGGDRKLLGYRLRGAEAFLGQPLVIRAAGHGEDELRAAAIGFVQWRVEHGAGPGLPRQYRHGNTDFGIKPGRDGAPTTLVPMPAPIPGYEKAS